MRKPNLAQREYDIFNELGLEIKGLKDLTKQNLSKDDKRTNLNK